MSTTHIHLVPKVLKGWSCTIERWPSLFIFVKALRLVNCQPSTYRNKICIDVITCPLRKNHPAMIIGADISIPVQVLVLWFSGFQKCIIIIQTFIPYMLQIKFQTIRTTTPIYFILLYFYCSTVNTFTPEINLNNKEKFSSVPFSQYRHCFCLRKPTHWTVFWEMTAVCCHNHTKHINSLWEQNAESFTAKPGCIYN